MIRTRVLSIIMILTLITVISCDGKKQGLLIIIEEGDREVEAVRYGVYYREKGSSRWILKEGSVDTIYKLPYRLFLKVREPERWVIGIRIKECERGDEVIDQEVIIEDYQGGYREERVKLGWGKDCKVRECEIEGVEVSCGEEVDGGKDGGEDGGEELEDVGGDREDIDTGMDIKDIEDVEDTHEDEVEQVIEEEREWDLRGGDGRWNGVYWYISAVDGAIKFIGRSDIDGDGYVDLVFANHRSGSNYNIDSYIYWGIDSGRFDTLNPYHLPTHGADGVEVADINEDGIMDIVFANLKYSDSDFSTPVYIYWGINNRQFDVSNPYILPSTGTRDIRVCDINKDGILDIITARYRDNNTHNVCSYIYFGTAPGNFDISNPYCLPTHGAQGIDIADINNDGLLDIGFANHYNDSTHDVDSYIYLGTGNNQFNTTSPIHVPAFGNYLIKFADMNQDGFLDIITGNYWQRGTDYNYSYIYWGLGGGNFDFSNPFIYPSISPDDAVVTDINGDGFIDLAVPSKHNGTTYNVDSYIFWGIGGGVLDTTNPYRLQSHGGYAIDVADINQDGFLDVILANLSNDTTYDIDSYIYWGIGNGIFDTSNPYRLPTHGAIEVNRLSVYNPLTGGPEFYYTSSILDLGASYLLTKLKVEGEVPQYCFSNFKIRWGDTIQEIETKEWVGRDGTSQSSFEIEEGTNQTKEFDLRSLNIRARYIQFKLEFGTTNFVKVPEIRRVSVVYER